MEVANVPKPRWKLVSKVPIAQFDARTDQLQNCYICQQRMGACIQCSNKNCYQAFHVTCARKAKLFLKMKGPHGGLAITDASSMQAFCDKHVPQEHRRLYDVEAATAAAKEYYKREMRHRKWADSQQSALSLMPASNLQPIESIELKQEDEVPLKGAEATQEKKRRYEAERKMWKMPSGAPIVPQVVVAAVDNALLRFTIRKRKEFVAEACKYWTLKREARRGAALLKRLQLQMETFSTMEITRRDFVAMGAAGRPRLQRRIEFAEVLQKQMLSVIELCKHIKDREELKLQDSALLKETVNTVYFPVMSMCWPIMEKALWLARAPPTDQVGTKSAGDVSDVGKRQFTERFRTVQSRLEARWYTSVSAFSVDMGKAFHFVPGLEHVNDVSEAHQLLSKTNLREEGLTLDQRDVKKLAKRVARALHQLLAEALRHEAELVNGAPFEHDHKSIEISASSSDQVSPEDSSQFKHEEDVMQDVRSEQAIRSGHGHVSPPLGENDKPSPSKKSKTSPRKHQQQKELAQEEVAVWKVAQEPLTPPSSEKELPSTSLQGGIPWYFEGFEPSGLIIQDERYDGLKIRREMSEPLSEMDEAELTEIGVGIQPDMDVIMEEQVAAPTPITKKAAAKKRRRSKW
jgi:NuA3 HAT complex component NTO1